LVIQAWRSFAKHLAQQVQLKPLHRTWDREGATTLAPVVHKAHPKPGSLVNAECIAEVRGILVTFNFSNGICHRKHGDERRYFVEEWIVHEYAMFPYDAAAGASRAFIACASVSDLA